MTNADQPQDTSTSPCRLIVAANYDSVLERAFAGKPYELVVQPISGFTELDQSRLQGQLSASEAPILYKIHRSFSDAEVKTTNKEDSTFVRH